MIEGISLSTNQLLMLSFSNSFSARRTTGPACFLRRYAWTAAGCQPSHWRSATAYGADERFDLCTILDALALLHPAADIHGIGFDPGDGLGHVVDGQAAGEDDRLAQARWYQGPVECRAGSPGNTFHIGIEENPAGTRVSVTGRGNVITGLDPQRLDIGTVITFALLAGFIAMELQQVQRHRIEDFPQLATAGIDEQADGGHERRQGGNNRPCLLEGHRPRAFGIKHKTNGVGPGIDGGQRIFNAGNPANFAANGGHVVKPRVLFRESPGW